MGFLKIPRVRMYWQENIRNECIANALHVNRFFCLRGNVHFVNEHTANRGDRMYKVRPIMDRVRVRLSQLPLEKNLCVDEQMVPFKRKLDIKQYIRGKPCPWGITIFLICGQSGMPYDFIVYQGNLLRSLGLGGAVLFHLANRISADARGHALYFVTE